MNDPGIWFPKKYLTIISFSLFSNKNKRCLEITLSVYFDIVFISNWSSGRDMVFERNGVQTLHGRNH